MNQIDFGGSFLGTQFVEGFMYVAGFAKSEPGLIFPSACHDLHRDLNFVNGSMQNMPNPPNNIDVNWLPMEYPQYPQGNIIPQDSMR